MSANCNQCGEPILLKWKYCPYCATINAQCKVCCRPCSYCVVNDKSTNQSSQILSNTTNQSSQILSNTTNQSSQILSNLHLNTTFDTNEATLNKIQIIKKAFSEKRKDAVENIDPNNRKSKAKFSKERSFKLHDIRVTICDKDGKQMKKTFVKRIKLTGDKTFDEVKRYIQDQLKIVDEIDLYTHDLEIINPETFNNLETYVVKQSLAYPRINVIFKDLINLSDLELDTSENNSNLNHVKDVPEAETEIELIQNQPSTISCIFFKCFKSRYTNKLSYQTFYSFNQPTNLNNSMSDEPEPFFIRTIRSIDDKTEYMNANNLSDIAKCTNVDDIIVTYDLNGAPGAAFVCQPDLHYMYEKNALYLLAIPVNYTNQTGIAWYKNGNLSQTGDGLCIYEVKSAGVFYASADFHHSNSVEIVSERGRLVVVQ